MTRLLIVGLAALLTGSAAPAQVNPASLKWMPGPPGLPKGAQFTVLAGDPSKAGIFTLRARMPAGYIVPPHSHPTDESLTIISGQMAFGMGSRLNRARAKTLSAGGFAVAKANMNHYVFTRTGTTIQVTAEGPFAIKYVNPRDDPRRR